MITVHKHPKRTRSELKQEQIQRILSVTKSPQNKKVKDAETNKDADTKDNNIARLETIKKSLTEAVEKKKEELN